MSGYLVSLVQRARGEGAALQPRVRARFEPGGVEEMPAESETRPLAPRSSSAPPAEGPHVSVAPHVRAEEAPTAALSVDDGVKTTHEVQTTGTTTTRAEAPASEPPALSVVAPATATPPETAPPLLPGKHSDGAVSAASSANIEPAAVRIEHSVVRREIEREREQVVPHAPLRVHTTRSVERHSNRETTRVVTPPHEEDAEPQPIRITIGRIDVRAIAPPVQSRPSPAAPKRNAPLTLDDYLRRRDGEKR